MRRLLCFLFVLAFPAAAFSVELITATVIVTNHPAGNSSNITVNASTRTWTNSIASSPGTLIRTTNSIQDSATNLWLHLATYPVDGRHIYGMAATNQVKIYGYPGEALTVTFAGNWAEVTYVTNTITDTFVVRVPRSAEYATNATNIASLLANYLDASTTAVSSAASALSNYVNLAGVQVSKGQKVWLGSNYFLRPMLTNAHIYGAPAISGVVSNVTNGVWWSGIASTLTVTNLSVPGSGANSMTIGSSAIATNANAMSVGNSSIAGGDSSVALGASSVAVPDKSVALGYGALVELASDGAIAIGWLANVTPSTPGGIALGRDSFVDNTHTNSVAIGNAATTLKKNQIMLGTSSSLVTTPGRIEDVILTNTVTKGTNVFSGMLITPPNLIDSIADGTNRVSPGTNYVILIQGTPTAIWGLGSIISYGVDGQRVQVINATGYPMVIPDQWGGEATAEYRIVTGTGANISVTNSHGYAEFIYDGQILNMWRLLHHSN